MWERLTGAAAAAALVVATAAPASATDGGADGACEADAIGLARADRDGDGVVTAREWNRFLEATGRADCRNLDAADLDGDGDRVITRAELGAGAGPPDLFEFYDADLEDDFPDRVDPLDLNDDGILTNSNRFTDGFGFEP